MKEVTQLEQLEQGLVDAKALVAVRDMAIKLSENREFKKLVLDEFMVKECARYAQVSGDPALSAAQRADALALAQAAGHLKRWLSIQIQIGNSAAGQISEIEATIEEVRAEENQGAE